MYEELGGGAMLPYRVLVQHPTINELLESCTSYRAPVRTYADRANACFKYRVFLS